LNLLPPDLVRKIAHQNAVRLYKPESGVKNDDFTA